MENLKKIVLRRRSLRRVVCFSILLSASVVMTIAMWGSLHWDSVASDVTNVYMRAFSIMGACLLIELYSFAVWEKLFPRVFPKYDRFGMSLVLLAVFCILGCIAFLGFFDVSMNFWLEDVKSFRFLVPIFTLALFIFFCRKLIFYTDYDPWLVD